jgi:hypothetical protein
VTIRVTPREGRVEVDGHGFEATALPPFIIEMVRRGGLVPYVRRRLSEQPRRGP